MVPASTLLDVLTAPGRAIEFASIRVAVALLAVAGWWLTKHPSAPKASFALAAGGPLLSAASTELMIVRLGDAASPYYAGLNLCILAVAVLYTWRWERCLLVSGGIILIWLIPAIPQFLEASSDRAVLSNNLIFLLLTAVIAVASAANRYTAALREYRANLELSQATDELSEAFVQLKEADQLKSEFFANVSHELRTPLTLILGPVEDLLGQEQADSLRSSLSVVRRNAQRLLRLIDDLLDLSRLDHGGLRLNVAEVDLRDLVQRLVGAVLPTARLRGLRLDLQIAQELPAIYGDPHRLEIILTNLLGNAVKFTQDGGRIRLRVDATDTSVTLTVADNGPGISPQQLSKIFDRFYQAEGSQTRTRGGAGIGLSLARQLAELHGGELTAESELGAGASFHLKLRVGKAHLPAGVLERRRVRSDKHPGRRSSDRPKADINAPRSATIAAFEEPGVPVLPFDKEPTDIRLARGRRARVLVAEDEADLREFIVSALSREFEVTSVADGRAALEVLKKERPDLVVSDIMMPQLTGTELCRAVKADPQLRNIPLILLTARSSTDATLEGYSAGADDFIAKPFHTRVLIARVKAQLKLRSLGLSLADQARLATAGALAAGIAHEIKNPLNAVVNAARALNKLRLDAPARAKLTRVVEAGAEQIADIVSVVEDHVRPAEGAGKAVCRIEAGVDSTLRLLRPKLSGIKVHYDASTEHNVIASGRELNQVIMNLIDNAVRAKPMNIWLSVGSVEDFAQLHVTDDGVGVPTDYRSLIFEPFFTTRRGGEGSGLGLYLSQRILRDAGGELHYEPRAGGGSTLAVRLPLFEKEAASSRGA